jgi:hypothetical protein
MKTAFLLLTLFALTAGGCKQSNRNNAKNAENSTLKMHKFNDVSLLPEGIAYEGELKDGIRYSDKSGEHIVIIAETGEYYNPQNEQRNDGMDAELFAYHFDVNKDNTVKQTWRVYDFYKDCPVDIAANFIENTFQATDLNDDGIAEIWLAYITGCKGDVSPWDMKIIMYEGKQKFAMRGTQKIIMQGEIFGGEYQFDNAFNNGLKVFQDFAKKLWNENGVIDYDKK